MSSDWRLILGGVAVVVAILLFMTVVIAVAARIADKVIRWADGRDAEETRQVEAAIRGYDQ